MAIYFLYWKSVLRAKAKETPIINNRNKKIANGLVIYILNNPEIF